jgi:hypothetical protein
MDFDLEMEVPSEEVTNSFEVLEDADEAFREMAEFETVTPAVKKQILGKLGFVLRQVGDRAYPTLAKIYREYPRQSAEDRSAFLGNLTALRQVLLEWGIDWRTEAREQLIPLLLQEVIRKEGCEREALDSLAEIVITLSEEERRDFVLREVVSLTHDEASHSRITGLELLTRMASCFGPELTEHFVCIEVTCLVDDAEPIVRKEAVAALPALGRLVNSDFLERKILPSFLKRVRDPVWGVRKVVAETLGGMSELVKPPMMQQFSEAVLALLADDNKWVRLSAYKLLGKLIHVLSGFTTDDRLLLLFIEAPLKDKDMREEMVTHCAYSLPAVLMSYGPDLWPDLRPCFDKLIKSKNPTVMVSLAASVH